MSAYRACPGHASILVERIVLEGFMGSEVPVAKLCDGSVYFLIPVRGLESVISQLHEISTPTDQ